VTGNKVRHRVPLVSLLATAQILFLVPPVSRAQNLECRGDDYVCLTRSYEQGCREPPRTTRETCAAWLQRVESHPFADRQAWRLIAATGYRTLSEMSESPNEASKFKAQSLALLQGVLSENPAPPFASEAYLGLAALTQNPSDNLHMVRLAVKADAGNAPAAEVLAHLVANGGSKADLLEAAEFMRAAYSAQQSPRKWYLAGKTITLYEAAGALDKAHQFRNSVYIDSGMDRLLGRLDSVDDGNKAKDLLSVTCNVYLVGVFGENSCLRAIKSVADVVKREQDSGRRRELAEAVTSGMISVVNFPDFGDMEKSTLQVTYEMFISLGIDSAVVYRAYSQLLNDPVASLAALEKAATLAPHNGQIIYELGLAYLERGRWKEAINKLEEATPILPQWVSEDILAMQLQRAQAGLASARP
jgi:tetratricopeptide (TPR) repeat protein